VIVTHEGKRYREHRYVMARKLGRELRPEEDVDHIDRDRENNDPTNLRVLPKALHGQLSSYQRKNASLFRLKLTELKIRAWQRDPESDD
jgi:hypothetical protein